MRSVTRAGNSRGFQMVINAASIVILLLLLAQSATAAPPPGQWLLGRATYYGAPESFSAVFDPVRGEGSFGVLEQGSCGFTNSDGTLPFPRDSVAAAADTNPDFPGTCGRCYVVRCKPGLVLTNEGTPLSIRDNTSIYLPSVKGSQALTDSSGRKWPGNSAEAQGNINTQCYDPKQEIMVRIVDTCPCIQVLPDGAPGVRRGGEIRRQKVCCQGPAGIDHFDLSFWAFEKLAHPLFGQMMLEYRPVDCSSESPVPYNPGFVNRTDIYQGGTKAGWNWSTYFAAYGKYQVSGIAPDGQAATCVQLSEQGGLSFAVRQGFLPGYQPFNGVKSVRFWLKSDAQAENARDTSTPPGKPVDIKVFLQNFEFQRFCDSDVRTGKLKATATAAGGWSQYTIPFANFRCTSAGATAKDVNRIDFQNPHVRPALFCLAGLDLIP